MTSTDVLELKREQTEIKKLIQHYKKGINNKNYLIDQISQELEEIKDKFLIKRKSKILDEDIEMEIIEEELIPEEEVLMIISKQGYIKKVPINSKSYSSDQIELRDDDIIVTELQTSNMNNLIIFTSLGKYYTIPIYKIVDSKISSHGEHLSLFFNIDSFEEIISIAIEKNTKLWRNIYFFNGIWKDKKKFIFKFLN